MTGKQSIEGFHKSRSMFCILKGEIYLAPENSTLSHNEWFETLGWDAEKTIQENIRGFADDRGLFFYKGEDFHTDENTEKTFFHYLKYIQKALNLPDENQVYGGVTPTPNTGYPPKKKYGTIKQIKTLIN